MSIPVLVCTQGPLEGQSFEITPAGLRIGRDHASEVHLPDGDISRFHARVLLHNGAVWVQDAGSRNGVFVNDGRVTEHKQLGPGDRMALGTHRFSIELQDPVHEHSVSVNLSALSEPKKKWRIWPFALAAVLVVGCVGVIGLLGGGGGGTGDIEVEPAEYSLSQSLGEATDPATEADPGKAPSNPLGAVGGVEDWPDPPEGSTVDGLIAMAEVHEAANRHRDALEHYQMALKLDPECALCPVRISKVEKAITEQIDEQFQLGRRALNNMQYQQAVTHFETVMVLEPDETSTMNQDARRYLEEAEAKGGRR